MKKFTILLPMIVFLLNSCMFNEIKDNKGIALSKITSGREDYRSFTYRLNYSYSLDNREYFGESSVIVKGQFLDDFIGKSFPIVYSTKNPQKSILLVSQEDFEKWGLVFPDSLSWVTKKIGY